MVSVTYRSSEDQISRTQCAQPFNPTLPSAQCADLMLLDPPGGRPQCQSPWLLHISVSQMALLLAVYIPKVKCISVFSR